MLIPYLKSRLPWILFFLGALLLGDLIIIIDDGIEIEAASVLYMNVLLAAAFALFVLWRWRQETAFLRKASSLTDQLLRDWEELLPEPPSDLDQITAELLTAASRSHREELAKVADAQYLETDYLAAWVHEAKAPLTAIKLIVDEHRGNPAMRRLEAEWLRLHLLIDRQLYISRMPTLAADFLPGTASVRSLNAPEIRELAAWCMEKDVAVELEGEDYLVRTDEKWARFIIRQILTNAVKYSPAGATITITADRSSKGNVRVRIKDEGPGIPAHDLPRIFEKSFTGSTGRIHNAATGLGLYLANTVAARLGIHLSAVSKQGQGTVLTLTFPKDNEFDRIMGG
ncbi:two-component system, OmpR family, bacitracin resistance sensor histidine kinase BceS [Bhargavaea beijingensis]|uniref:histidine kinase n=1 Tax=Bhargavaea beijingensis TaxID=426756 RepID=A0A1G6Z2P8_9BACL|nr:sensor histidine kinase [Bhargavaea beijingensis]SDD96227.1 two-component system, OmpR family, bacitracin resistance sensor histidine kinase BceS [Bhargavaea beijingensis]